MVQESIVEYINSQMKAGVSRDAIKTTLTGAGWVAADVEDTLKKVEAAKAAAPAGAATAKPASATTGPEPQTIKVSDLISAAPMSSGPAATPASAKPAAQGPKSPLTGPTPASVATPPGTKTGDTFQAALFAGAKPHSSRTALIIEIVLGVIILAVGGFAGFLFMQNNSLNSQLTTLNGQSSGVTTQLATLQSQMVASTTALTAQVAAFTAESQELQNELSFLTPTVGLTPGATSTATVSGTVALSKVSYVITATYGTKIFVTNSKSAAVIAALNPLMATAATAASTSTTATSTPAKPATPAATAQFTGMYLPGSDSITITAVNGTSVQ